MLKILRHELLTFVFQKQQVLEMALQCFAGLHLQKNKPKYCTNVRLTTDKAICAAGQNDWVLKGRKSIASLHSCCHQWCTFPPHHPTSTIAISVPGAGRDSLSVLSTLPCEWSWFWFSAYPTMGYLCSPPGKVLLKLTSGIICLPLFLPELWITNKYEILRLIFQCEHTHTHTKEENVS